MANTETVKHLRKEIKEAEKRIEELNKKVQDSETVLYTIQMSSAYRWMDKYFTFLSKNKTIKFTISSIKRIYRDIRISPVRKRILAQLIEKYNPYYTLNALKPITVEVISQDFKSRDIKMSFSLITTIYNESHNILNFLQSIVDQTLTPDEVVIVDGGSGDNTVELIKSFIRQNNSLNIKLHSTKRHINIAEGRNIGIAKAKNEILLFVDAGCVLEPSYCKNIIGTYVQFPSADLVGGIYKPQNTSPFTKSFIPDFTKFKGWENFLPSARAVSVKKTLLEKMGGTAFPEYLTLTGEDTFFDIKYRRVSSLWVFNKQAVVYWKAPETQEAEKRLLERYTFGDGESGYGDFTYYDKRYYSKTSALPHQEKIQLSGYLKGRNRRADIEISKRKIKGVVIILAGVPITDSGGAQRCTQLALEFIKRNYKVIYVNLYPSYEPFAQKFFDIDYSLLELYYVRDFSAKELVKQYKGMLDSFICITEFPHIKYLDIVKELRRASNKTKVIYDYIDNWQTSLGWNWYISNVDQDLVERSQYILASAQTLKLEFQTRFPHKKVHLVPNAVNTDIFDNKKKYDKPKDLPKSKYIVTYTGAMWGEWFNWDLLEYCLKARPNYFFMMLGGYPEDKKKLMKKYKNIKFLGLKPQTELPAYLRYSSVCMIPFKEGNITQFVNPLKIYEYTAMGKKTVTTPMPEIKDIPDVYTSYDYEDFCENLDIAIKSPEIDTNDFVNMNNWKTRVDQILKAINA